MRPTLKQSAVYLFIGVLFLAGCSPKDSNSEDKSSPNVLFISVDDLNDWNSLQGGQPQARTPNLERLADQGVYFSKAYCAAPACNPSRVATLTGIAPSTSGIYYNEQSMRLTYPDIVTLPQHFRANGYTALGSGKIFHRLFTDSVSWDEYAPALNKQRFDEPEFPSNVSGMNMSHFDWGAVEATEEEMADARTAKWVSEKLEDEFEKPFFMAFGIYRPHLPWYVPQQFLDMYPIDQIELPATLEDDLEDVPSGGKTMIRYNDHQQVTKYDQWKYAIQGYLASISFMDAQLGKVLDALENSSYRENTIVVLWSDHGWNLGEKQHWRKFALWERTTRVPLIIVPPGGRKPVVSPRPINLLDIYPTLIEMCGIARNEQLDGHSLVPLLNDPNAPWSFPSLTSYGDGNHAIRTDSFRFISYKDGTEELYDMLDDPREYQNLVGSEVYEEVLNEMRGYLPRQAKEPVSFGEYESSKATKPGI